MWVQVTVINSDRRFFACFWDCIPFTITNREAGQSKQNKGYTVEQLQVLRPEPSGAGSLDMLAEKLPRLENCLRSKMRVRDFA